MCICQHLWLKVFPLQVDQLSQLALAGWVNHPCCEDWGHDNAGTFLLPVPQTQLKASLNGFPPLCWSQIPRTFSVPVYYTDSRTCFCLDRPSSQHWNNEIDFSESLLFLHLFLPLPSARLWLPFSALETLGFSSASFPLKKQNKAKWGSMCSQLKWLQHSPFSCLTLPLLQLDHCPAETIFLVLCSLPNFSEFLFFQIQFCLFTAENPVPLCYYHLKENLLFSSSSSVPEGGTSNVVCYTLTSLMVLSFFHFLTFHTCVLFYYVYITFTHKVTCWWTFRLISFPGYGE